MFIIINIIIYYYVGGSQNDYKVLYCVHCHLGVAKGLVDRKLLKIKNTFQPLPQYVAAEKTKIKEIILIIFYYW